MINKLLNACNCRNVFLGNMRMFVFALMRICFFLHKMTGCYARCYVNVLLLDFLTTLHFAIHTRESQ
jgi:hypothetical protein